MSEFVQNLDSGLYKRGLQALTLFVPDRYCVVGGIAAQIVTHSAGIPKRTTTDVDISIPRISYEEFVDSYGEDIARHLKNKHRYGFHLTKNQFANTVHFFNKKNPDLEFLLLHFNRYQPELYERIIGQIERDLDDEVNLMPLSDLGIDSDGFVPYLSVARQLDFKRDKIRKKSETARLEAHRDGYAITVLDDIQNGTDLSYVDFDSFLGEINVSMSDPNNQYQFTKDIYDYAALSQL